MERSGWVLVLNGVPRSGKSSVARAMQAMADEPWVSWGVDAMAAAIPERFYPGIGLRPGGERPDLEPLVETGYRGMFSAWAGFSRAGLNVVADVGLHEFYAGDLQIWEMLEEAMAGVPAVVVGIRCPLETVRIRRVETGMEASDEIMMRWDKAVHTPGVYDLEFDTAKNSPEEIAADILRWISDGFESRVLNRGR